MWRSNPLRRLVVAGKDTVDNMRLLFGPNWYRDVGRAHEDIRTEVLLNPPKGSSSEAVSA